MTDAYKPRFTGDASPSNAEGTKPTSGAPSSPTHLEEIRKRFEKSTAALGHDITFIDGRYVNERTDDVWRGFKCAIYSMPKMTKENIIRLLMSVDQECCGFTYEERHQWQASALIAKLPHILKDELL